MLAGPGSVPRGSGRGAEALASGDPLVVIDVRDPDEFRDGHWRCVDISRGFLEFRVGSA